MGIRITKVMGYGVVLSDEEWQEKQQIVEKFADNLDENNIDPVTNYAEFLKNKYQSSNSFTMDYLLSKNCTLPEVPVTNIFNFIPQTQVNGDETKKSNVLLVSPPLQHPQWCRTDNDMDYIEHLQRNTEPSNIVTTFNKALYPFNQFIMHKETGLLLRENRYSQIMIKLYEADQSEETMTVLNELSKTEFGMPFLEVYENYTVASVPQEIQDLAEWVGLTKVNENITHKLTPMIAEYWN